MIKLFVAYTGVPPVILKTSSLMPIESPKQNYSELWVHKKIWREEKCDAVGIFHSRRYLDLSRPVVSFSSSDKRPLPYRIKKEPDFCAYTQDRLEALMRRFDVIAPVAERTGISVLERFGRYPAHRKEDLELACKILLTLRPDLADAAKLYLSQDFEYYGNLFLMKWDYFDAYCRLLFEVLEQFEKEAIAPPSRTPGYLGERIFGIYFTWLQTQKNIRCGEAARVHFWGYDDATHHLKRDRIINFFLPPSSRRRIWVKKIF